MSGHIDTNALIVDKEAYLQQKKKETLAKLDNAKFGCFHVRACIVSGIGFFTRVLLKNDHESHNLRNLAMLMMGCVYYKNETGAAKNSVPVTIDTLVKTSAQLGALIGQLFFGYLADRLGRKRMYGIELMIIVVCTCASCLSASTVSGLSVFAVLGIWRLLLGIGIGGDYPLSEFATTKRRGGMMAAVFAMQGFGILVAATVAVIILACFRSAVIANQDNLDYVWRICIGLGAVPGVLAIYFRLTIPETPRYTLVIDNDIERAANDVNIVTDGKKRTGEVEVKREGENKANLKEFFSHFSEWKNLKVLLGTSISWFALDVAFYGINLNSGIILTAIGFNGHLEGDSTAVWDALFKNAVGNVCIALMGTVPGYWVTVFLVDKIGRKTIQILGFAVLTALFVVLGFAYDPIREHSIVIFIAIFVLAQFFQNFGPNTTTFIIPGEVFPTKYRSTAHGISAALGKLGAIVSSVGFFQLKDLGGKNKGIPLIIKIFSAFMLVGLIVTFLLPETKGKTLEQLNGEAMDDEASEENSTSDKKNGVFKKILGKNGYKVEATKNGEVYF